MLSLSRIRVQTLVGELRSHKPLGKKNKIIIKNTTNQSIKQKRSVLSGTENELVVISGEREGGRAI